MEPSGYNSQRLDSWNCRARRVQGRIPRRRAQNIPTDNKTGALPFLFIAPNGWLRMPLQV